MPTIIKLCADSRSLRRLNKYLASNRLPTREEAHSNVFYSNETPVFQNRTRVNISDYLPIAVSHLRPAVFDRIPVLLYDDPAVRDLNHRLVLDAVRQMIIFPDQGEDELEILRQHRVTETEFVNPGGLRVSNQRSGLVGYTEFNPHVTISQVHYSFHSESLPYFHEEIVFDTFSWKIIPPVAISDMAR